MPKRWIYRFSLFLYLIGNTSTAWILEKEIQQGSPLQPILIALNHLVAVLLGLAGLAFLVLLILDFTNYSSYLKVEERFKSKPWKWSLLVLLTLVLVESVQDILLLGSGLPKDFFPIYLLESVKLFYWAGLASLLGIILIMVLNWEETSLTDRSRKRPGWLLPAGLAFLVLVGVFFSGSGYIPDSAKIAEQVGNFASPNAPLILPQILIYWLLVSMTWLGLRWAKACWPWIASLRGDLPALLLLGSGAFLLWSSVPLSANYFLEAPRPPTYQYNVASDSIYYEIQAHRFLAGEGFANDVQHPLYSFFLSGLHLLGGEHFQDIYLLQIAFLSVMPFLLYKLTSLLSSDYGGWLAGGLLVIREYNGLLLADSVTLSTVNLLMTESISMLGVMLVVYLMVSWLKKGQEDWGMIPLIGGVIGLLALLRVELLSLAFVFGLVLLARYWQNWRSWLGKILLLAGAIVVVIVPWMTRNWVRTGDFYLDKGKFFQRTVSGYLSRFLPGEESEPSALSPTPGEGSEISLGALEKAGLHLENNLVDSLIYLPSNHQLLGGADNYLKIVPEKREIIIERKGYFSDDYLTAYVKSLPYWDQDWDGAFSPQSFLPISLSLGIILAGLWYLWKRDRLTAITPLLVLVLHSSTYAVFSRSGGRFVQVVDWIPLMYYSIGLSRISGRIFQGIDRSTRVEVEKPFRESPSLRRRKWGTTAGILICLIIGVALPVSEALIPDRYTDAELRQELNGLDRGAAGLAPDPGPPESISLYGKVLYPGYYKAGKAVLDDRSGRVPPADRYRLVFYLVGTENIWVSLPIDEAPLYFPHGSEVIVQGEFERDSQAYLQAGKHPYFLASQVYLLEDPPGD